MPAICADLATLREAHAWRWGLNCLAYLAATFGTEDVPRLLALGPSTLSRIRDVREAWPGQLTIASQDPARSALGGKLLLPDLVDEPADPATNVDELLDRNIATYIETVGAICNTPEAVTEARHAI